MGVRLQNAALQPLLDELPCAASRGILKMVALWHFQGKELLPTAATHPSFPPNEDGGRTRKELIEWFCDGGIFQGWSHR